MTDPAQTKILSVVRGVADDLHVLARQRFSLRRSHTQNISTGFESDVEISVRPQHRRVGNVAGNAASSGQRRVYGSGISAQYFSMERVHRTVSTVTAGHVVQAEDSLRVGLHVDRIHIVQD